MSSTKVDTQTKARDAARRWRWIGLAILTLPTTLIAVFAIAEGIGLEPGWWGHLIQLAVLTLSVAGAWLRPRIGGPLLILLGVAFAGSVLLGGRDDPNVAGLIIVALPLIASGVSFTLAGRSAKHDPANG